MKRLLLLRHAKSDWDNPDLADIERPLAPRGIEAALLLGHTITQRNWLPDRALVSAAERTRETWRLVAGEWMSRPEPNFSQVLYEAPAETVLDEIRRNGEDADTLLVIGHNPGLGDLAALLAGKASPAKLTKSLNKKFPTGALAVFDFDGGWAALGADTATLTHFLRPKDLG
ncbi:MAG TPA: histidine phosphatase family protein [Mesorhizobium sp.]|jgi:phosphohistidine phosphatase|uniref:SixA phosphatase family protein n=1 Tax=Mesorhizobium sp. TaxID=1871066 RepID=UPI002DDCBF6C|nr:histidine phosphatase family protein [Mesorhizobium sp.]HEV2504167.1 histidine phosphatase family protein [Mesorhizobium sp.]